MENLAQLAPAIILAPAIGAIINFFWGARLGERASAMVGSVASATAFIIAVLLFAYLTDTGYRPAVIDPPLLGSWIRMDSVGLNITWQSRVDTLSVTMMMFVTFVGTLIHIYAAGYMHGDPRFSRFFGYLNMFLAFMLILVSGNNFLMMFVGWEGVGLCSYLLIGFWWEKPHGEGWANSNAARKAFIANRVGDFGVLMAIFLIFYSFGTLDFYKPLESANPNAGAAHGEEGASEEEHSNADFGIVLVTEETGDHGDEETSDGGEEDGHGEELIPLYSFQDEDVAMSDLGVFGQAERMIAADSEVKIGPFSFGIETLLVIVTLFMLLGATGKSAQIPLFVWLPDAMAGPTPVSALIHAATMVTAGVYMMVRANVFFHAAELTSFIVTIVGVSTALVAGFIAVGQFDIKRVLAYSTISQLGFMVAAVGIGAYGAAIFHMFTHAFFKALLFLGSGSVIHGMEHGHHHVHEHGHGDDHHEDDGFDPQDMRFMGGLRNRMPLTYWTYLIGTLALAGVWPFAGFWSKDEILADSWLSGFDGGELKGYIALAGLVVAAGFTAFYMWRQIEMVFHGEPRHEAAKHAPESVSSMTIPLVILALGSIVVGFFNVPSGTLSGWFSVALGGIFGKHSLANFLEHSVLHLHVAEFQPVIAIGALGVGLGAIFAARSIYGFGKAIKDHKDPLEANPLFQLANARLYWDEAYFKLFINPFGAIARFLANVVDWQFWHDYVHDSVLARGFKAVAGFLANPVDLGIIDGAVNGTGWVIRQISGVLSGWQTGYVRTYAVALFVGVIVVMILILEPLL